MQTNSWGIQCRSVWELSANDHWLVNQIVLKNKYKFNHTLQTNSWGIQCRSVWELSANDHWLVNQMVLKINTNSIIRYLCFELEVSKWFLSFQINPKPIIIKCIEIWFLTKIIYKCFTKQCFAGLAFWFQSNKNQFLILNTNSRQT